MIHLLNTNGTYNGEPQIHLTPEQVVDGRIGELFRPNWPTGFIRFATVGLECLCTMQPWSDAVSACVDNGMYDSIVEAVNSLLRQAPISVRLLDRELLEVLQEVQQHDHPWELAQCSLCKTRKPGAKGYRVQRARLRAKPGESRSRRGRVITHLCLACCIKDGRALYEP